MAKFEASVNISVPPATVSGSAKVRTNLAVQHIFAAANFARNAGELEAANAGQSFSGFFEEILWNVSASVFFAVAALEADVNEIFIDADLNFREHEKYITDEIWRLIEQKSILEKYEMVLTLKKKANFVKGVAFYQNADSLIKLRNALVHFKPEWSDEKMEHLKIENRLNGKFPLSPFLPSSAEFFPKKCMSFGCADWAVKTALSFRGAFSILSELPNRFEPYLSRLATK